MQQRARTRIAPALLYEGSPLGPLAAWAAYDDIRLTLDLLATKSRFAFGSILSLEYARSPAVLSIAVINAKKR
jgi:hypothetical protein